MSLRIEIEAETYSELLSKIATAVHLPCDIGIRTEIRPQGAQEPAIPAAVEETVDPPHVEEVEGPLDSGVTDEAPRRKRRTKAEMEAARASQAASSSPPLPLETPAVAPAPVETTDVVSLFDGIDEKAATAKPAITEDQLREKLQKLAARDGGSGLKDLLPILGEFGYQKVKGIKPEHYRAIAARVDDAMMKAL